MYTPATEFNLNTIAQQVVEGLAAIDSGQTSIDFSQTKQSDSSAVACLLVWKRHAQQCGHLLEFQSLPASLTNLISLYGVTKLL